MSFDWNTLVEALRNELQEYGAIRATLDEQQEAIFNREGEKVSALGLEIESQINTAAKLRQQRENLVQQIAGFYEFPLHSSLSDIRSVFPEAVQPLLKALVEEINNMLNTLRRRSRQNQMLLARTCEVMEQTLQMMRPGNFVKTYSARGSVAVRGGPVGAHIQTAG